MPFINTTTNVSVSPEKEIALKAKLGSAIELLRRSHHGCIGDPVFHAGIRRK